MISVYYIYQFSISSKFGTSSELAANILKSMVTHFEVEDIVSCLKTIILSFSAPSNVICKLGPDGEAILAWDEVGRLTTFDDKLFLSLVEGFDSKEIVGVFFLIMLEGYFIGKETHDEEERGGEEEGLYSIHSWYIMFIAHV